jgi:hypothetical protein
MGKPLAWVFGSSAGDFPVAQTAASISLMYVLTKQHPDECVKILTLSPAVVKTLLEFEVYTERSRRGLNLREWLRSARGILDPPPVRRFEPLTGMVVGMILSKHIDHIKPGDSVTFLNIDHGDHQAAKCCFVVSTERTRVVCYLTGEDYAEFSERIIARGAVLALIFVACYGHVIVRDVATRLTPAELEQVWLMSVTSDAVPATRFTDDGLSMRGCRAILSVITQIAQDTTISALRTSLEQKVKESAAGGLTCIIGPKLDNSPASRFFGIGQRELINDAE